MLDEVEVSIPIDQSGRSSERNGVGQPSIHPQFLVDLGGHHLEADMVGFCELSA